MFMKDGWVKPAKNRRLTPSPSSENGEQSYFLTSVSLSNSKLWRAAWTEMTKQSLSPKMSLSIQVPAGRTSQRPAPEHNMCWCWTGECVNDEKRFKTFSQKQKKGRSCWSPSHHAATQTDVYDTKEASCDKNNTSGNTSAALYDDDARENV